MQSFEQINSQEAASLHCSKNIIGPLNHSITQTLLNFGETDLSESRNDCDFISAKSGQAEGTGEATRRQPPKREMVFQVVATKPPLFSKPTCSIYL